jgi:EmrB/QacA subfamily drug resistance transporter
MPASRDNTVSTAHAGGISSVPNGRWVLAATILASSMAFIDGTAVTVALPAIQSAFHASGNEVQWIVEAYALFLASLLLVGGSLGDRYGRRLIFVAGVLLFAAGSAWCGLAPSVWLLISARTLQGVGAALLLPGSLALLTATFPKAQRGKAIGIWSGFSAMMAAVGPVLGGWLVDNASWRWVFFLNLPLVAAIVAITILRVPESHNPASHMLDWPGALLATLGLGGMTFALIEGRHPGFLIPLIGSCSGVALVALFFVERRSQEPMLPLDIFRSADFTGASLITLFLYTALNGLLFYFPINLIQVQHYSATAAGAALLPLILLLFALSKWSGGLIGKYGARGPLTIGPIVAAVGFALAAIPSIGGSYWTTYFPAVAVLGVGMAICVAPLTTACMDAVATEQAGTASGINNGISRLASLIAVALFGLILQTVFQRDLTQRLQGFHLPPAERQSIESQRQRLAEIHTTDPRIEHAVKAAFVKGFRRILWLAVGLSLASALSAQLLSNEPTAPNDDNIPGPEQPTQTTEVEAEKEQIATEAGSL